MIDTMIFIIIIMHNKDLQDAIRRPLSCIVLVSGLLKIITTCRLIVSLLLVEIPILVCKQQSSRFSFGTRLSCTIYLSDVLSLLSV